MTLRPRWISLFQRHRSSVSTLRRTRVAVWASALMVVMVGCAQATTALTARDAISALTPARTAFGHPTSHHGVQHATPTSPGKTAIPGLVASVGSAFPKSGLSPDPTAWPTGTPGPTPTPTATPGPTPTPTPPPSSAPHVLVVMEENKGYAATLGTCSADPFLCSLAAKYATFTNSHGIGHPSMPNYYAFISGATQGCATDGCGPFGAPSLGSQLNAAGVPWTAYMESMPSACDKSNAGGYVIKHDPFVMSSAITSCASHVLPYPGSPSLLRTLDSAGAPDFVWVTPNLQNDMHDGSVQQGDAWLSANLAPVLASPWFLNFPSTVIVTMDEGDSGGANQVPTVVISSVSRGKGAITTSINHYAVLRAIEAEYGLGLLGSAASAPDISALWS